MSQIYGQIFINKHGAHDVNGTWLSVLQDLTPKALESGIERLKNLDGDSRFCQYPPNSLEFKALCLAFYNDLRLPTAHHAFIELQSNLRVGGTRHHWTHDVVKFTASRLSVDFLKIDDNSKAFKVFKQAYEQVCHLVKQGHSLPTVLNEPEIFRKKPQSTLSVARFHLDMIRQRLRA